MTKEQLSLTICPYCNSKFSLNKIYKKNKNQIEYGTASCHCDEFPIIFGILYLHKNNHKKIVYQLKKNQLSKALYSSLNLGKLKTFCFIIFTHFNRFFRVPPNNFINSIFIKLLWNMPQSQYKYYFFRHQEIESLLFFLPLTFSQLKPNSLWLDVGSGISNYYSKLQHLHPKLTIVSLEMYFQNIFLSKLFFPKNVIYLCSDFSYGPHLPSKKVDVVTFIDSLPFMKNQRVSLEIASQNLLKTKGLLFASSLVERLHTSDYSNTFPLSQNQIRKFLPSSCQIFDEIILCQQLSHPQALQNSLLAPTSTPKFRYSLLWPSQALPSKIFIPPSLLQKKHTLWQNDLY